MRRKGVGDFGRPQHRRGIQIVPPFVRDSGDQDGPNRLVATLRASVGAPLWTARQPPASAITHHREIVAASEMVDRAT